jgi:hypothetical protein
MEAPGSFQHDTCIMDIYVYITICLFVFSYVYRTPLKGDLLSDMALAYPELRRGAGTLSQVSAVRAAILELRSMREV